MLIDEEWLREKCKAEIGSEIGVGAMPLFHSVAEGKYPDDGIVVVGVYDSGWMAVSYNDAKDEWYSEPEQIPLSEQDSCYEAIITYWFDPNEVSPHHG